MIAQAVLQLLVLKILNLPVSVVGRTFILSIQRVLPLDALLLHAHHAQNHILAILQGKGDIYGFRFTKIVMNIFLMINLPCDPGCDGRFLHG